MERLTKFPKLPPTPPHNPARQALYQAKKARNPREARKKSTIQREIRVFSQIVTTTVCPDSAQNAYKLVQDGCNLVAGGLQLGCKLARFGLLASRGIMAAKGINQAVIYWMSTAACG